MSQLLYKIRSLVPKSGLSADATSVRLEPSNVDYDVAGFVSRVARGEYVEAARQYSGPFLDGYELASRNFEDWRSQIGRDVQQKVIAMLSHLAKTGEAAGDWDNALSYATRLIEADPINEVGHLVRLRVLAATEAPVALTSETARLRDTFAGWEEHLPRSLETLLTSIERGSTKLDSVEPTRPKFLGRLQEYNILCDRWSSAQSRAAQIVRVSGVAGVGKTRLIEHFLRWTALKGARVLTANCSPPEQRLAYSAVTSAWSDGVRAEDLQALAPGWRKYLMPFIPGIESNVPIPHTAIDADHRVVFEANGRLMSAISDRQPVVVFFDNANWMDDSSARLIHYLFHKLQDRRLLFLFASRSELPVADHLISLFPPVANDSATSIHLGPLEYEYVLELVRAESERCGFLLGHELQEEIILESRGVPFHLLYRLREAVARRGAVPPPRKLLTESTSAVREMLHRLSPAAREGIEALAVLGRRAGIQLVNQVVTSANGSTFSALRELSNSDLVTLDKGRLEFAHDIIHEDVLESIDNRRREELHASVATVLRDEASARAAVVTLHFAAAGRNEAAAHNAIVAAEEARVAFAFKDAEFFYQLAMNKAPTRQLQVRAIALFIDFLCSIERLDEALNWLKRWRVAAETVETPVQPNNLQLLELYRASIAGEGMVDLAGRVAAMNATGGEFSNEVGYRMLRILLQVAHVAGCAPSAEELSRYIEVNLQQLTTSKAGCELLSALARCWAIYIDSEKACEIANAALSAAELLRDPTVILLCMVSRATVRTVGGELYGAEQDFDKVLNCAENPELAHFRERSLNNVGLVLLERGKLAEANSRLFEALGFVSGPDQVMIRANLTLASLEQGAYSDVARRVEDLDRANSLLRAPWVKLFSDTMHGWVALNDGRVQDAVHFATGMRELVDSSRILMDSSYSESLIARLMAMEDPAAAAAYCDVRGSLHRKQYVLGALRLALEAARSLRTTAPEDALARARSVLAEAEGSGASNIAKQAVALLAE